MKNIENQIVELIEEYRKQYGIKPNTKAEQQIAIDVIAQLVARVYPHYNIVPKITDKGTKIDRVLPW